MKAARATIDWRRMAAQALDSQGNPTGPIHTYTNPEEHRMNENPDTTPNTEAKPRPIAAAVPKRERTRLVKAELLGQLAQAVADQAATVGGYTPDDGLPFDQWPDTDPMRQLCHRYAITPADLARIMRGIGRELANSAERRGLAEVWQP